jgi:hypothetical protein
MVYEPKERRKVRPVQNYGGAHSWMG